MATIRYRKKIADYLNTLQDEDLFTSDMVTDYVASKTGEEREKVRKATNVNLARFEKEGLISRISKGIYSKAIKTPFGNYAPDKDTLFNKKLTRDGNDVIGYETGLSLMNQIGLISQLPKKKEIATNLYESSIPKNINIEISKPRVPVTNDNYRYFQILDVINKLDSAPIDTGAPDQTIKKLVDDIGLAADRLILYARKYYPVKTLEKTIDVMFGGNEL